MSSLITPAEIAAAHSAEALPFVTVFTFLVVLILKELATRDGDRQSRPFARILDIAVVPLGLTFGVIVVARLLRVFG